MCSKQKSKTIYDFKTICDNYYIESKKENDKMAVYSLEHNLLWKPITDFNIISREIELHCNYFRFIWLGDDCIYQNGKFSVSVLDKQIGLEEENILKFLFKFFNLSVV